MMTYQNKFDEPEVPEKVPNAQSPRLWRRDDSGNGLSLLAEVTTLAWNLVLPIVGGVMLGHFIDSRMGSEITWTLSLLTLGIIVALTNLYNLYLEHGLHKEKSSKHRSTSEKENHAEEK